MAHVSTSTSDKARARLFDKLDNGWMFEISVGGASVYLTLDDLKVVFEAAKPILTLNVEAK